MTEFAGSPLEPAPPRPPALSVLKAMGTRFGAMAWKTNKALTGTFLLGALVFSYLSRGHPLALVLGLAAFTIVVVLTSWYQTESDHQRSAAVAERYRQRARERFGYTDFWPDGDGYRIDPGYGSPFIGGQGGPGGDATAVGGDATAGRGGAGGVPGGGGGAGGSARAFNGSATGGDGGNGGPGRIPWDGNRPGLLNPDGSSSAPNTPNADTAQ